METFVISSSDVKAERYELLVPQIENLVKGEPDLIANMANVAAALRFGMDFFWVGFYLVKEGQLVLGPFQGPIACTRIPFHKGVCGACYTEQKTMIVPNVDAFPGHIACSSESKSEIVLPGIHKGEVAWVLDIDSDQLNTFDQVDQHYLEKVIAAMVQEMG